ncbi:hypothetical protein D9758_013560 [Tetrapyrgos nigripes]|uniref:Uncharacterized protein n=1 Tax=Tetrapyrgos nigripes TaxID=182062 RepID=A0A8H5CGP1_9AGAR|nr:hypothetical protein D9758_013560 [Tetrapyrgos nigripes]
MSEMNAMNIGAPRTLTSRARHSRTQSAVPPRFPEAVSHPRDSNPGFPNVDDGANPNAEKLYTHDGRSAFNVDPNAPVLSGAVGKETMEEIERQKGREEEDQRETDATKAGAGGGNRFVGGFLLGLKNTFRPRWGNNAAPSPRDPFPAFPTALYDPEPPDDEAGNEEDDRAYDHSQHDRERAHHPGDVEYHAGASRRDGQHPEYGLRHRNSYQSLDSPSETEHPTTEWHDDGTTAVDHTGYNYAQYPVNHDAHGNPVPPLIPPPSTTMLPNPENPYAYNYDHNYPPNFAQPQSNYLPANSNRLYDNYTVGSPILADIKPASDYAKMDIPPSTTASDVSFNTYLDRMRRAIDHVNSLPWVAERVTVDYYPAGIRREKLEKKEREKERIRRQDEEKLGPGGLFGDGIGIGRRDRRPILSWYDRAKMGLPTNVRPGELDLTAGSPPPPVPPLQDQAQPSMAQAMATPYSPLAQATLPPIAMAPSAMSVGMTSRPGDAVPLAPGLYPNSEHTYAASGQPLVPPSSSESTYDEDYDQINTGMGTATPGGSGATVRLTSPNPYEPPAVTLQPSPNNNMPTPGSGDLPPNVKVEFMGGYPNFAPTPPANSVSGSVNIDVVPPSTTASASVMSRTPVIPGPSFGGSTPDPAAIPVVPSVPVFPPPSVSPPRSTTHSQGHRRSPSVPITSPQTNQNPPPSSTLRRMQGHIRAPSAAGSVSTTATTTYRRPRNPNTPSHYFPANVPATSAPPRTPVPTAPPTPSGVMPAPDQTQTQGQNLTEYGLNAPNGPNGHGGHTGHPHPGLPLPPGIMPAHSEGGHSDRSGKSGISAMTGKSGRSWVVVNGPATPSSSSTDSRDLAKNQSSSTRRNGTGFGNGTGTGFGTSGVNGVNGVNGHGVNRYQATPKVMTRGLRSRRDTLETAQTPISVNPSSQFETPVVSTYAGDDRLVSGGGYGSAYGGGGYGGGIYDRKGKGRAPPASVQTVSDSGSGSGSGGMSRRDEDIYEDSREQRRRDYERYMRRQASANANANGGIVPSTSKNGRVVPRAQVQGGGGSSGSGNPYVAASPGPAYGYGYAYSNPRSRQP